MYRAKRSYWIIAVILLLGFSSPEFSKALQQGSGGFGRADVGNLRVRITYSDDRATTVRARVRLFAAGASEVVAEGFCNDAGMVEFNAVPVGGYHLIVSGEGLQETDSGSFEVDSRKTTQSIFVAVRRTGENNAATGGKPGTPSVSVDQLRIPEEARNKVNEANQLMAKADWVGAIGRLNQAIAIYPTYAEAYNNLAVAHARLGNRSRAREALLKAISVDDHFVPGLVNLSHMEEREQHYQAAETLLSKAVAVDPSNAETLTLLCRAHFLAKHNDTAIDVAHRVHAMPHGSFAIVHYIAARAYQRENRTSEAIAEFKTLLQEEPSGARADAVRKELADTESRGH
jgi:tetratricopeptide (TPR) repeat protein